MVPPERAEILSQLQRDAERIAQRFQLSYRGILAEHPRVKSRYGVCYADGLIKIRLNHAKTGKPLKYSSLVDTLCHELAHLRHFNHGPEFKAFFFQLLAWARRERIYRPGRADSGAMKRPALQPGSAAPLLCVPERNGVPVFPELCSAGYSSVLPWERWLAPAGSQNPATEPAAARSPVRRVATPPPPPGAQSPTRRAPEQLSFF